MAYADVGFGVIKDARRRQRRRHLIFAGLVGLVGLGALALIASYRHQPPSTSVAEGAPPPLIPLVSPRVAFWHQPYIGVTCPTPDSIACDRVGLAVWLRRPAVAVTASITGRTVRLWSGAHSLSAWRNRPADTGFTGYLQRAGLLTTFQVTPQPGTLTWFGAIPPTPLVTFHIDYGHGKIVATQEHVPLMAGWG